MMPPPRKSSRPHSLPFLVGPDITDSLSFWLNFFQFDCNSFK